MKISTVERNPTDRPELGLRGTAETRKRLLGVSENHRYDQARLILRGFGEGVLDFSAHEFFLRRSRDQEEHHEPMRQRVVDLTLDRRLDIIEVDFPLKTAEIIVVVHQYFDQLPGRDLRIVPRV